ncbi:hypothetical protein GCM10009413_14120 [Tatumella punctata]
MVPQVGGLDLNGFFGGGGMPPFLLRLQINSAFYGVPKASYAHNAADCSAISWETVIVIQIKKIIFFTLERFFP